MTKYEFSGTDELTEKAYAVYSDSSFTFYKDGERFFVADNPSSAPVELGTIKDVNEFLESFAE